MGAGEMKARYIGDAGVPVIREPGNAAEVKKGTWRTYKPIFVKEKCTKCKLCFIYCPEAAIRWNDGPEWDYDLCSGCMICYNECNFKAIEKKRDLHE